MEEISAFILGPSAYSNKPCKSIEQANEILVSKLRIAIKTKIREYIDAVLSKYSDDTIEFVSHYLSDLANLEVEELVDNEWIATSADKDKRELRLSYLETGSDEDLFSSINQFDEICEALQLSEKYN